MALDIFSLPDLGRFSGGSEEEIKQLKDYLYQLTEQLKYQLSNLDEQNLSASLVELINSGTDTSQLGASSVQQFVANLRFEINNTGEQVVISLVSSGTTLDTKIIRFPKATVHQYTLQTDAWDGDTYTVEISGITSSSMISILPALGITREQLTALQRASLQDGGQESGKAHLIAFGTIPEIDIPIRVVVDGG